ncbi:MAG: type II toxin-antitoxin system prevent-host-death family antitoxin [Gemmatimonadota bacterium]|nr:type II toxin-antitoxin system prevent-host-death family antitoxin [Gemmatimonadota bacterium]
MTKIVKLYDAKTHLSDLVERAARGEEFIIAKGDEPKARLIPVAREARQRVPGAWEGRVWISEDFDAPLPIEISDAFEGKRE